MRLTVACGAVSMALALAGCAATPAINLPPSVENGLGSQHGNYGAETDGEMRGPSGERCVLFNWDRPLTRDLALRLRSASCESRERPGWMVSSEISRTVIPMSQSDLMKGEPDQTRP
ncbi:MAG: hypothetical protein P4M00_18460 [Azospirillaceae bacterium]|nr:hypothetical protein [Azospirillaceae bacterium]